MKPQRDPHTTRAALSCNYCPTARRGLFLNDDPKHKRHMPPPSLPLSLSVCLYVSRPLSPGEAAPNQRCDLFIRRLQTRPRRRHERPRLVLTNCLICLSGDPPPTVITTTDSPPPLPFCHLSHPLIVSPTTAPTRGELVCDKLRANSGALLAVAAGMCVRLWRCWPLCSPSPSSSASPSSSFIPLKRCCQTLGSKSSGGKEQEEEERL